MARHNTAPTWRFDPAFLESAISKSVVASASLDEEKDYLCTRAPNAIEWVTKKEYLDQPSLFKFYGAYSTIKEFFELRCPDCNSEDDVPRMPWVPGQANTGLSRDVLESEVLLAWSATYEDDVCPKCRTTRSEFVERGAFNNYRVLHAIIGQRSGKTLTLAQIGTYIEHITCTIAHSHPGGLAGYFGGAKNETYDVGWVASTRNQGEKTIWGKYLDVRANSPWFQRYVPWVKLKEKTQDTPKGMLKWVYDENTKSISNGLARLQIDCLSSNSHANAGGTRLFAAVDEISRMSMTEGYRSGPEVYSTMLASCATIQASVEKYGLVPWLGMIGSISSPYSLDDYGMQLLQQAKVDKRMYAFRRATWDFNPEQPFENFATELRKDYVKIMRNFGAQPPGAASPLIDRPDDFIKFAVDPTLKPNASFIMYDFIDKVGCEMRGIKLDKAELIVRGTPRYIAADAGANFDAFSVACGHGEYDDNGNVITVFDWVIRLLTKSRSQEVYFESIYQLLKELQPKVPIKAIEFDHWNSKPIVQRLRDELGLWAEEVAISDDIFLSFMRDAYSGQVRMLPALDSDEGKDPPYMSAQGAAIYELLRLERNEKDKILNPLKGLRRGHNCGRGDTLVTMADGTLKALADVKVDESVLGQDGVSHRIEASWCSGTPEEVYEVCVYGRPKMYFTSNHEWPVWSWTRECACGCGSAVKQGKCFVSRHHGGRGDGQNTIKILGKDNIKAKMSKRIPQGYSPHKIMTSEDMRKGDFLMVPRKFDAVVPSTSLSRARLLGYYASEGHTVIGSRIDFAFGAHERDTWVADVCSLMRDEGLEMTIKHVPSKVDAKKEDPNSGGLVLWSRNGRGHARVDSKSLVNWLTMNAGSGAATKKFSDEVMHWPLEYKVELLRGLFRGDGCQSWTTLKKDGRTIFSVTLGLASRTMVYQVDLMLAQLGFPCRHKVNKSQKIAKGAKEGDMNYVYYLAVSSPYAEALADLLWGEDSKSSLHGRRTANAVSPRTWMDEDFLYLPITNVKKVENTEPVYNLTVADSHTYLAYNVATHNSDDTARCIVHVHKLVQEQGYTLRQDDTSRRARRKRGDVQSTNYTSRGGGSVIQTRPTGLPRGGGQGLPRGNGGGGGSPMGY